MRMALRGKTCWDKRLYSARYPSAPPRPLADRIGRRIFLHILPFLLMLLVMGWLSLKAGDFIDQAKQPPGYAILADR